MGKWKRGSANVALRALEYLSDSRKKLTAEAYRIYATKALMDATGAPDCDVVVAIVNADPKLAKQILDSKPGSPDGRSKWKWIRFSNGDLMLACYPCGDTYEDVTQTAGFPV